MTPPGSRLPTVSVVVPTFERPQALVSCLDALVGQDYPRERFEIVVVDDGGRWPAEAALERVRATDVEITVVRQRRSGPAAARNRGAARAGGELLAFTDDDCAPAPGWLRALAERAVEAPGAAVGGRTVNVLRENAWSTASQLVVDLVYGYYNAEPARARFFASNNLAVPAERLRALGGFDETFRVSEDRDLCDRWRLRGWRLLYEPRAVVGHVRPLTIVSFWRQHFAYGRGACRFHRARRRRGSGSVLQDAAFHAQLPRRVRSALRGVEPRRRPTVVALLGLWQAANALGFVCEALAPRPTPDAASEDGAALGSAASVARPPR